MSDNKTTETLDKLYLEWSQFTYAKTRREIDLERQLQEAQNSVTKFGQEFLQRLVDQDYEGHPEKVDAVNLLYEDLCEIVGDMQIAAQQESQND